MALERTLSKPVAVVPARSRSERYAAWADAVLTGADVGSSAAGELGHPDISMDFRAWADGKYVEIERMRECFG